MKTRDSFIFYRSFYDSINKCPVEVQVALYNAVARYALNQEIPDFSDNTHQWSIEAIWNGIRPQLDANMKRYLNGCKGGCPKGVEKPTMRGNKNASKKQNQNKTKTKPNDNVNVNDNENVNENENLILPYSSELFATTWNELRKQPKWRGKTNSALRVSLKQLSAYPEPFAIELMESSIVNNWQGVVFDNTDEKYESWKAKREDSERTQKVITNINDL